MIKIKRFRIKNYKSIKDTGECYLADRITIFAGKNESGKTSILEALEDFDSGKEIRATAVPIKAPDLVPEVSVTFDVDKQTLQRVLNATWKGMTASADASLEIVKTYPDTYSFERKSFLASGLSPDAAIKASQKQIALKWREIKPLTLANPGLGGKSFDFKFADLAGEKELFLDFKAAFTANSAQIADAKIRQSVLVRLNAIGDQFDRIAAFIKFEAKFLDELVRNYVPYVVLPANLDSQGLRV